MEAKKMKRYMYKVGKYYRSIYFYDGVAYSGRGCHMRCFAAWGRDNPKKLRSKP